MIVHLHNLSRNKKKRKLAHAEGGKKSAVNGIKSSAGTRQRSLCGTGAPLMSAHHTHSHCHTGRSSSGIVVRRLASSGGGRA